MASCSSLLSEEQVLCSICREAFTEPVSTPCGHNLCKVCVTNYWDTTDVCQCPLCKNTFYRRPELHVNTTLRDLVESVKTMTVKYEEMSPSRPGEEQVKDEDMSPSRPGEEQVRDEDMSPSRPGEEQVRDEDMSPARPGEVPCDVCTDTKLKALKSCLRCLTSYCETHMEPHLRVAAFKKHTLVDPVENLEDRMCKKHDKLLELFCRKDQVCVCLMCMNIDHKTHDTVTLEEECGQRKDKMAKMKVNVDEMMETRSIKVQEIKQSVEISKRNAERETADIVKVFTTLVSSIQRSQDDLIQVMEEKHKATEKQADDFIQELEQEITELKRRSSELEQLSHSEDHLHFLQSFTSLSSPPHTMDWSQISVHSDLGVGDVSRALSQLEDTLLKDIKQLCESELKRIQQYAADVTLDPDTAHPQLILTEDRTQVRNRKKQKKLPGNPERFDYIVAVLGKQSFSSGRFYYEVQVEGKTRWTLGVARESINRKGKITAIPGNGYWTIYLRNGDEYMAAADAAVLLSLREKPQKVGVFVDYEEGQVSFYNVETRYHIYSYTGCTFTEKLYPYFCPCLNDGGKNSAPLIITPVTHTA